MNETHKVIFSCSNALSTKFDLHESNVLLEIKAKLVEAAQEFAKGPSALPRTIKKKPKLIQAKLAFGKSGVAAAAEEKEEKEVQEPAAVPQESLSDEDGLAAEVEEEEEDEENDEQEDTAVMHKLSRAAKGGARQRITVAQRSSLPLLWLALHINERIMCNVHAG